MASDDIFDRYSRDAKPAMVAAPTDYDVFSRYERPAEVVVAPEGKKRLYVSPAKPRGDVANASGFNNRMVSSIPVVGPLFDKAAAAAGAAIQPMVSEDARKKSFGERYSENLAMQDARNELYGEEHPILAPVADVTGATMALGPMSGARMSVGTAATRLAPRIFDKSAPAADTLATNIGQRMLGMRGNSLGARVYQGAGGMGVLEGVNQLIKGNNLLDQGFFGPVPLAVAGGAAGPVIGEGISKAGNALLEWMPRRSGPLAGVNSTGRNMLVNAVEGETPASIAEAQKRFGPAGMLADVNQATTDLAGGLADIPGPHKQVVREAYRQRAAGQAERIEQSLNRNTVPQVNLADLTKAVEQARATGADPLYQQYRTMAVQPTKEIKALIPRLEKAGAFDLAEELSGISGNPINRNFFTGGPQKAFPTAETWDYVKRGLDRRISQALDKTKPDKDLARELLNLKNEMLAEIDKTPAGQVWQKARQTYAEHSELLHQIEEGQKTFKRSTRADELAREMINLSQPEQAARLQGARDAIQEVIDSSVRGDTTARNMLLSKSGRAKLELLFGKQRADRLVRDLEAEVFGKQKVENVIGGSQTTPKKERVNAMLPAPSEMGYFQGLDLTKPASFIPEWMKPQTIMEGARAQRYGNAYQQIAPLLTTKMGAPEFNQLVQTLLDERAMAAAQGARFDQMGRGATLATGALAPSLRNRLLEPPARTEEPALRR